jgi:hypothetical protein
VRAEKRRLGLLEISEKVKDDLTEPAWIFHVAHMSHARQHDHAGIWNLLEGVDDSKEIRQVTLTDNDQCRRLYLVNTPSRRRVGVTYVIGVDQVPS